MSTPAEVLRARLAGSPTIGLVGLGYVGLPLAVAFAESGAQVLGVDSDTARLRRLAAGDSFIEDVPASTLGPLVTSGRLAVSEDFQALKDADAIVICVPTPLGKSKDPDISFILGAADAIAAIVHRAQLVVLESTTYPGTTEELLAPILSQTGLQPGRDFFLCFSPERVDPGNLSFQTRNIPKVVGGMTPACTEMGVRFYSQALETVVPVSSTQVAEMVKLLENTFRMINIGLVNELAMMCDRMAINIWEVIAAAKTKPFGFMPFYPGPGLGGHCIPIDPFYLSWKSRQAGIEARFIELAGYINGQMPEFTVGKVQNALNEVGKPLKGAHIHIVGVAYKSDIDDVRESPALDIIHLLTRRGANVTYSDPHVPEVRVDGLSLRAEAMSPAAGSADCVVIVTNHAAFDYEALAQEAKLVVDTRNALGGVKSERIVRL